MGLHGLHGQNGAAWANQLGACQGEATVTGFLTLPHPSLFSLSPTPHLSHPPHQEWVTASVIPPTPLILAHSLPVPRPLLPQSLQCDGAYVALQRADWPGTSTYGGHVIGDASTQNFLLSHSAVQNGACLTINQILAKVVTRNSLLPRKEADTLSTLF